MIAIIASILAAIYLIINFIAVIKRNYKAHKFFRTKSPNIPVVPNPNIFSGHLYDVIAPGKNWQIIEGLHEKYGTTFGYYMVDQPWVSTTDLDLIKLIEINAAHKHVNRAVYGLPFEEFNHSIFQLEDEKWRRCRRAIGPALTNLKVRSDEVSSDIELTVSQLAASMERRLKKSQDSTGGKSCTSFVWDTRDMSDRYTLAVIFLVTYKRQDMIDFDCDQDKWTSTVISGAHDIGNPVVHASMMFPFLRPVCTFLTRFHSSGQTTRKIVKYITEATESNRKEREQIALREKQASGMGEDKSTVVQSGGQFKRRLVDTVIDAFLERKINYDNYIGSLFVMLLAGFVTTADTISHLLWQLARNPDVQEKLRRTIAEEGIDADYVMWCINETLRYHPAVPLGTGRVLGEDVEVNGQFLAKGTFVMPTTRAIHRDPKLWPEADKFNPERWRDQASFHPAAFLAFGLGPRNCIGMKLALHEIRLVLEMILANYRIELCDDTPSEWDFISPGMIYTLNDSPVKLRFSALSRMANPQPAAAAA